MFDGLTFDQWYDCLETEAYTSPGLCDHLSRQKKKGNKMHQQQIQVHIKFCIYTVENKMQVTNYVQIGQDTVLITKAIRGIKKYCLR